MIYKHVTPTSPGSDGGEVIPTLSCHLLHDQEETPAQYEDCMPTARLPLLPQTGMNDGQVICVMCTRRVATDSYLAGQLDGQSNLASRARQSSQQDSS